jgi:hypothetical protein
MILPPWIYGLFAVECALAACIAYDSKFYGLTLFFAFGAVAYLWGHVQATAYWDRKKPPKGP